MSEKRKSKFIFLLRNQGKKNHKIELFPAELWREKVSQFRADVYGVPRHPRYRVRANGQWYNYNKSFKYSFMTKKQVMDLIMMSTRRMF